jgi:hypothetical protein
MVAVAAVACSIALACLDMMTGIVATDFVDSLSPAAVAFSVQVRPAAVRPVLRKEKKKKKSTLEN